MWSRTSIKAMLYLPSGRKRVIILQEGGSASMCRIGQAAHAQPGELLHRLEIAPGERLLVTLARFKKWAREQGGELRPR